MDSSQQILDEIKSLRDQSARVCSAADSFGDDRKIRAHVISTLINLGGSADVAGALKKARQICEFIETGRVAEGTVAILGTQTEQ